MKKFLFVFCLMLSANILTATLISASCTDARLCTADGIPLDSIIGTFFTQGTVTKGTSVIKIKSNSHTYAKE